MERQRRQAATTHSFAPTYLAALVALSLSACGAAFESYPYRACLFDVQGRFDTGRVVTRREDGARLFQFDDPSKGDHGFRWVEDQDVRRISGGAARET